MQIFSFSTCIFLSSLANKMCRFFGGRDLQAIFFYIQYCSELVPTYVFSDEIQSQKSWSQPLRQLHFISELVNFSGCCIYHFFYVSSSLYTSATFCLLRQYQIRSLHIMSCPEIIRYLKFTIQLLHTFL